MEFINFDCKSQSPTSFNSELLPQENSIGDSLKKSLSDSIKLDNYCRNSPHVPDSEYYSHAS